jgi:zinc transporter ZupT
MLGFAEGFLPWTASTLIPAFVGLLLIVLAGMRLQARYIAAFAFGILFWFFVDTVTGAASLEVNSGFSGGVSQAATVGLFVVGVIFFFSFDRNRNIFSPESATGKYGLAIPVLVAVALGIHGLGEGAAFGGTAALTTSTSLLEAFGGIYGGIAYVLHKALEPMIIGACYCAYSVQNSKTTAGRLGDLAILSVIFAVPSLVGAATGYYLTYDSSYFYALGTGTAIYAAVRLFGLLFNNAGSVDSKESLAMALLITLGFLTIYFAALFHSG